VTVAALLERLADVRRTGRGWSARCPAHTDRVPSLRVAIGNDGRILLHDHGGCRFDEVVRAIGLQARDLFAEPAPRGRRMPPRLDWLSPLGKARQRMLMEAERQPWARHRERYILADHVREGRRAVEAARATATRWGPTSASAWRLLGLAADLELDVLVLEAGADLAESG
jgi:hypothetical protein